MQVIMHSEGFNFVLFHSVRKMKNSATMSMKVQNWNSKQIQFIIKKITCFLTHCAIESIVRSSVQRCVPSNAITLSTNDCYETSICTFNVDRYVVCCTFYLLGRK